MTTAARRNQLLTLLNAIMPALVEQLVQPEPPKPKVEHKVIAYFFGHQLDREVTHEVVPPEGDGWKLSQLDLASGLGHWTRVVMVESDNQGDTISSPPPEPETEPEASSAPPVADPQPMVPCEKCHQFPHSSTCPDK